jgi:hypothetical protein
MVFATSRGVASTASPFIERESASRPSAYACAGAHAAPATTPRAFHRRTADAAAIAFRSPVFRLADSQLVDDESLGRQQVRRAKRLRPEQ